MKTLRSGLKLTAALALMISLSLSAGEPGSPRKPVEGSMAEKSKNVAEFVAANFKLGHRMARAFACKNIRVSDYQKFEIKGTHPQLLGYGCYCGPGNTGLDTKPADQIDDCCRHHDWEWNDIYELPLKPKCDCYKAHFSFECVRNGKNPGELDCSQQKKEATDEERTCAKFCCEETNRLTSCIAKVQAKGFYNLDYLRDWQARYEQPYCQTRIEGRPARRPEHTP